MAGLAGTEGTLRPEADPARVKLPDAAAAAKDRGAEAFSAGRHAEALQCYDEALKLAPDAAVLHSNRAQTLLKLDRPEDALDAAEAAVLRTPSWARGWQRKGQSYEALGELRNALRCWERAAGFLPASSPDKTSHEATIRRLNRALGPRVQRIYPDGDVRAEDMPWVRFQKVAEEKERKGESIEGTACARMLRAAEAWRVGEQLLWQVRKHPDRPDVLEGDPMAIQHLSNAILADDRVVALRSQEFFLKFNMQIEHDAKLFGFERGPWAPNMQGNKFAQIRAAIDKGWDKAKWMLSLSIRVAVIKSMVAEKVMKQPSIALEELVFATGLVYFVRREYAGVPATDRGSCFEPSFERALQALVLSARSLAYREDGVPSHLALLRGTANLILASVKKDPSPSDAMRLTFDRAPAANALGKIALVCQFESLYGPRYAGSRAGFVSAAEAFLEAAFVQPSDDGAMTFDLVFALYMILKAGGATVGALRKSVQKVLDLIRDQRPVWEPLNLLPTSRPDRILLPWLLTISCRGFEDRVKDDVVLPTLELLEVESDETVENFAKKIRAGETNAKADPAAEAVLQRLIAWPESPEAALTDILSTRCP